MMNHTTLNQPIQKKDGVLIIAGLTDAHVNIGKEGRYDLLPIPWCKNQLFHSVKRIITLDMQNYHMLQNPVFSNSLSDSYALEIMHNGTGILAWIKSQKECPEIMTLLNGHETRTFKIAAKFLDYLSCHVQPNILFKWPSDLPDDEDALGAFETELFKNIKAFCR